MSEINKKRPLYNDLAILAGLKEPQNRCIKRSTKTIYYLQTMNIDVWQLKPIHTNSLVWINTKNNIAILMEENIYFSKPDDKKRKLLAQILRSVNIEFNESQIDSNIDFTTISNIIVIGPKALNILKPLSTLSDDNIYLYNDTPLLIIDSIDSLLKNPLSKKNAYKILCTKII
jgi:hypothetical protein